MVETLSKNITRQGLTATTLNYLRVSSTVSNIEVLDECGTSGVQGSGAAGGPGPSTLDPDSLPLPSAHTLTGQNIPTTGIDNIDSFNADSFQFH